MTWRSTPLPSNWRTIRAPFIGVACQLRYPGCLGISTEVDHIGSPADHSPTNLRGVCHPCHTKRTAQQAANAKPRARRKPETHPGRA